MLDKKLLKEVESGLEQQLEGVPMEQNARRLAYIAENLDRVYFFKQLIQSARRGGIMKRSINREQGAVLVVALIMLAMITFLVVAFRGVCPV